MRLPAILTRWRRSAPARLPVPTAEQIARLDTALAARRAGRAERQAAARAREAAKVRAAFVADKLLHEPVEF
ncbi:hypothetical protein [Sphingomonas morindae]|uniref:Uncharacterized protein n=1 Tax=Sphingomonas morindae TaxID=1541170 RepID=A0ABY4X407_9SPHN|nr:hypothetical protein [Sphingomonas morindae]USI71631.1 hypothetical protein LHA26_09810 [Sphingomonas morindae]